MEVLHCYYSHNFLLENTFPGQAQSKVQVSKLQLVVKLSD